MEIVSSRITALTSASAPSSTRVIERKDTSPQRRWNSSTNRSNRRESITGSGNSLLSLKAYYRKLRTFRGTVKALINLRRLPTVIDRTRASSNAGLGKIAEDATALSSPPKAAEAVAKLASDGDSLQTVQNQVKTLVEQGRIVTEREAAVSEDVTYRLQGNLDHYTEENLRKRLKLQEHPQMIALTQRLWMSAVDDNEEVLGFGKYEAFMLRLHRLILPEFDLDQSKELIKDDWTRDTDGSDHLDYRFFHFSMFELVDLWTDTVEAEDYISLLYCIMHFLTFQVDNRHFLRDFEDIIPIDILEASKEITQQEIDEDLARAVNSANAEMYREQIRNGNDLDEQNDHERPSQDADETRNGEIVNIPGHHSEETASKPISDDVAKKTDRRKSASPQKPTGTSSSMATSRKNSHQRKQSKPDERPSTPMNSSHAQQLDTASGMGELHLADGAVREGTLASGLPQGFDLSLASDQSTDRFGRKSIDIRGRQTFQRTPSTNAYGANSRYIYRDNGSNMGGQGETNGAVMSITSLGGGGEFINMVSRPTFISRPSMLSQNSKYTGMIERSIMSPKLDFRKMSSQYGAPQGVAAGYANGSYPSDQETWPMMNRQVPNIPQTAQTSGAFGKEDEYRHGSVIMEKGRHRAPSTVHLGMPDSSQRVRSARAKKQSTPAVDTSSLNDFDQPELQYQEQVISDQAIHLAMPSPRDSSSIPMTRTSILYRRPATSSGTRPSVMINSPFVDSLQARGYSNEPSVKIGRPLSRSSRVQQQRASQLMLEDLAITTLVAPVSPRTQSRPTMIYNGNRGSPTNQAAAAPLLGPGLAISSTPGTPRTSPRRTTVTKIGKLSRHTSHVVPGSTNGSLGVSAASFEIQSVPITPRKPETRGSIPRE